MRRYDVEGKIYVDWTEMGPGASPDDAVEYADWLRDYLHRNYSHNVTVIVGTGYGRLHFTNQDMKDEWESINMFGEWLALKESVKEN